VAAQLLAAQRDIARYVQPPGNYGGIPTGPHSLDQLPLYSGLTPLRRNFSMSDVFRFYLPMNFRPIGTAQNEPVGRSDVTVTYDAYGILQIKGTTRAGMMFGAGWAAGSGAAVGLRPQPGAGPPWPTYPGSTSSR
jgi:acyl-homoserine lactone acylase PvdQ